MNFCTLNTISFIYNFLGWEKSGWQNQEIHCFCHLNLVNRHSEPRIQERLARSVIQRFTLPVVNVRSGSCGHSMSSGGVPNIRWSEARVQLRLPFRHQAEFQRRADGRGLMFAKLLQILFQLRICMERLITTSGGRASRT